MKDNPVKSFEEKIDVEMIWNGESLTIRPLTQFTADHLDHCFRKSGLIRFALDLQWGAGDQFSISGGPENE